MYQQTQYTLIKNLDTREWELHDPVLGMIASFPSYPVAKRRTRRLSVKIRG